MRSPVAGDYGAELDRDLEVQEVRWCAGLTDAVTDLAWALSNRAMFDARHDRPPQALSHMSRAVGLVRSRVEDGVATSDERDAPPPLLSNLASILLSAGQPEAALEAADEAIVCERALIGCDAHRDPEFDEMLQMLRECRDIVLADSRIGHG